MVGFDISMAKPALRWSTGVFLSPFWLGAQNEWFAQIKAIAQRARGTPKRQQLGHAQRIRDSKLHEVKLCTSLCLT